MEEPTLPWAPWALVLAFIIIWGFARFQAALVAVEPAQHFYFILIVCHFLLQTNCLPGSNKHIAFHCIDVCVGEKIHFIYHLPFLPFVFTSHFRYVLGILMV